MSHERFERPTRFGTGEASFGGSFAPETLMHNLFALEAAWIAAGEDEEFRG